MKAPRVTNCPNCTVEFDGATDAERFEVSFCHLHENAGKVRDMLRKLFAAFDRKRQIRPGVHVGVSVVDFHSRDCKSGACVCGGVQQRMEVTDLMNELRDLVQADWRTCDDCRAAGPDKRCAAHAPMTGGPR